jgi:hypothetical protein
MMLGSTTSVAGMKRPVPTTSSQPPALEPISDESSLDDSTQSKRLKRVSWDKIQTREYALVVGDHPMCQDGLPVSLGWQFNDGSTMELQRLIQAQQAEAEAQQQQLSERKQSYAFPKRLSYEERRDRLLSVSNLTLDQIKNDEIDLVVRTLKESWETITSGQQQDEEENGLSLLTNVDDNLMDEDPLSNMTGLEDVPGIDVNALEDSDLGDISNFEWTDDPTT